MLAAKWLGLSRAHRLNACHGLLKGVAVVDGVVMIAVHPAD
jgi:hypothetical protein